LTSLENKFDPELERQSSNPYSTSKFMCHLGQTLCDPKTIYVPTVKVIQKKHHLASSPPKVYRRSNGKSETVFT